MLEAPSIPREVLVGKEQAAVDALLLAEARLAEALTTDIRAFIAIRQNEVEDARAIAITARAERQANDDAWHAYKCAVEDERQAKNAEWAQTLLSDAVKEGELKQESPPIEAV
jgi:hypothetical protein